MTTLTDTQVRSALEAVASAAGLQLGQPVDASAVAAAPGPFITREVAGPGGSPTLVVAVRDAMSEGTEDLCLALVQAVTGGLDGAEGSPVATGSELVARFATPLDAAALSDGDVVHALVLTAQDRRGGSALPASGLGGAGATALEQIEAARAIAGFDKLVNVALEVSVELGRTRVTLADVLEYDVGSVVELDRAAGAPVDVRVNGTLLAHGEVVLIDDEYAVRITAIIDNGGS
ncbi:MAG: flagellar motor switch protein FliN [Acidimicrobiia bacterium]|nr:flagellar motor switch protein FliN [Acidimicrobiia bacterium]